MRPTTSILSFKTRGQGGDSNYSGNFSPHIPEFFINLHGAKFVVDVCCGSDTTGDVCRAMGIRYVGLDLHSEFDVTNESLIAAIKQKIGSNKRPDLIFAHIPYHTVKVYSGVVYGKHPIPGDLSRCDTPKVFLGEIFWLIVNCLNALAPGGSLYIVVGDQRTKGLYRAFQAHIIAMEAAPLQKVLIKEQHNCFNDRKPTPAYFPLDYVPIRHEYIIGFKKKGKLFACGERVAPLMDVPKKEKAFFGTWRDVVNAAILHHGNRATTQQVFVFIQTHLSTDRTFLREKVRQTLNTYFRKLRTGCYLNPDVPIVP